MRRRSLALILAVVAVTSTAGSAPAQELPLRVVVYTGACELKITFHFSSPIGAGRLTHPNYWLEVRPAAGVMPCQVTDDPLDPLRNTQVTATGSSTLFDCNSAVASGNWSQDWIKGNGVLSPQPVNSGRHKVYGTWDNWVIETEGASAVNFAGLIYLTLDPTRTAQAAAACSNGSLWELHMIGVQVFEDPQA